MKIRRILSVAVPILAMVLVLAFILTFAIVPMGGGSFFAALEKLESRQVRFIGPATLEEVQAEQKAEAEWKRAASKKTADAAENQGVLAVLSPRGINGELDPSLFDVGGESGGFGGLEIKGTGGGSGAIGIGGRGTYGKGDEKFGYSEGVDSLLRREEHKIKSSARITTVRGSLDKEIIRRVIHRHSSQIRHCYERELARNPDLGGKVAVQFTIGADGRITGVGSSHGTAESAALERCISDRILTWRFPQPKGGGSVVVNYPFIFRSSGGLSTPAERSEEQMAFIPARGYFKNTYLPGDPALEWLRRRLEKDISLDGRPLNLERAVAPYVQPFDPPAYDGLAVYLNADHTYLEEPTRMTVQVGLKGSERHARRRACLNAALVVDLREASLEENRRILWSLADAMAGDLQAGDRFYLVVAGVEKPLQVEPARFDSSTVRRHLAQALGEVETNGAVSGVGEALDTAYSALKGEGSDDAPIGANLVLLASAAQLSGEIESFRERAHRGALDGVTLTAIGVGGEADRESLASLAVAGQGRRRILDEVSRARATLEEELSASGRVVARAVRLRIRLSKGVKLIGVLGSGPLDERTSERVRQAEQAIDFKVAETLGIESDRGDDEDGIQIVIPAFYAGDDHAVLLDVMAPGPGKIAEVRVRYKDLVNLRNAVARADLTLPAGRRPENPLSRNVQKNVLAHHLSLDLRKAGAALDYGQAEDALEVLSQSLLRIQQLRMSHPTFSDDPELARDEAVLAGYRGLVQQHDQWSNKYEIRTHLVDSLAYAGRVKLPPGAPSGSF